MTRTVEVEPGTIVRYRGIGLDVYCNLTDPEFGNQQVYVGITTEELDERFVYGDGMPIISVNVNDAVLFDDEGRGNIAERVP